MCNQCTCAILYMSVTSNGCCTIPLASSHPQAFATSSLAVSVQRQEGGNESTIYCSPHTVNALPSAHWCVHSSRGSVLKVYVGCSLHCTVGKCGKSSVNQLPYGIACYVPKVNFAWLRCTHHIPAFSTVVYK